MSWASILTDDELYGVLENKTNSFDILEAVDVEIKKRTGLMPVTRETKISKSPWVAAGLSASGLSGSYSVGRCFEQAGISVEDVDVEELEENGTLLNYDALIIGGGFAHGDYLRAGVLLAHEILDRWGDDLLEFVRQGRLVFGVCNGFQVLTNLGLIKGLSLVPNEDEGWASGTVTVRADDSIAAMAQGIPVLQRIPVAHQEGRVVVRDYLAYKRMVENGQIVLRYAQSNGVVAESYPHNPNGSAYSIASACNEMGTVMGMMPHPEMIASHFVSDTLEDMLEDNASSFFAAARIYLDQNAMGWRS